MSTRAKSAIGLPSPITSCDINPGEPADFVIFGGSEVDWTTRKSIAELIYDAGGGRMAIKEGRLTSGLKTRSGD